MRIHGVGHEDRRHHLVSHARQRDADDGGDVPVHVLRLLGPDEEHHCADDGEDEACVAQPQAMFGGGWAAGLAGATIHPEVGEGAAELLADDGADDEREELVSELLGVEGELLAEQLREFDGHEDGAEEEGHGVGESGDGDAGFGDEGEGVDEIVGAEGRWVDAMECEVFFAEGGSGVLGAVAEVARFGAEE